VPAGFVVIAPRKAIGASKLLTFEANDLALQLAQFPEDWADLPEPELIELLQRAGSPAVFVPTATGPQADKHPARR